MTVERMSKEEAVKKLNPHLLDLLPFEDTHDSVPLAPADMLSWARLDVAAKYIYGRSRELGIKTDWPGTVYREHLRVWCGFKEGDGSGKNSFEAYLAQFHGLLDSIRGKGFDPAESMIPVGNEDVLIDGSHRAGACLVHGTEAKAIRFNKRAACYDYRMFREAGLAPAILDAMALEYCRLKQHTFVACLFPAAAGRDDEVESILREFGKVFYQKDVVFTPRGAHNLTVQLYKDEPWLGSPVRNFPGTRHHVEHKFLADRPVRFFFLEASAPDAMVEAKTRIRAMFSLGNDSIHINNSHDETVRQAEFLLNEHGIHFLNYAGSTHRCPNFLRLFPRYKFLAESSGIESERFCVDGSATMAAYGLRDCRDLDYLSWPAECAEIDDPEIGCHNSELGYHPATLDEIVFDPANHFHYDGMKLLALPALRRMKAARMETKDARDIALIDGLRGGTGWLRSLKLYVRYSLPRDAAQARHKLVTAIPSPLVPPLKAARNLVRSTVAGLSSLVTMLGPAERKLAYKGFDVHYSRGTSIIPQIRETGTYEQALSAAIVREMQERDASSFLDVGANVGLMTLNVLSRFPHCSVFAFEPGHHQYGLLERTIKANSLEASVRIFRQALGETVGTASFAIHSPRHASGDGFRDTRRAGKTAAVEVQVTTLDSWWKKHGRPRITVGKIDTEGSELWVLRGAVEFIRECRPTLFVEIHPENLRVYPHTPRDIADWVHVHDCTLRTIEGITATPTNIEDLLESTQDFVIRTAT